MRCVVWMLFCVAVGSPVNGSAAPKKNAAWPLMDRIEAECASATADQPRLPMYRTTHEERYLRLFVVNEEPVRYAPSPSSRTSRSLRFGDQCNVDPGTLLEQVLVFPDDDATVIVRVVESSAPGYGAECPEGAELLIEAGRWKSFVKLQSERDLEASREACRKRVLKRIVGQVRGGPRSTVSP